MGGSGGLQRHLRCHREAHSVPASQEARFKLGIAGNSCSFRKRSKLLRRMVDGRGLEPPASSLRTLTAVRTANDRSGHKWPSSFELSVIVLRSSGQEMTREDTTCRAMPTGVMTQSTSQKEPSYFSGCVEGCPRSLIGAPAPTDNSSW